MVIIALFNGLSFLGYCQSKYLLTTGRTGLSRGCLGICRGYCGRASVRVGLQFFESRSLYCSRPKHGELVPFRNKDISRALPSRLRAHAL